MKVVQHNHEKENKVQSEGQNTREVLKQKYTPYEKLMFLASIVRSRFNGDGDCILKEKLAYGHLLAYSCA